MKHGFDFGKTIAVFALVAIGAGCSTCNYKSKDAGTLDVSRRPLSLAEVLTEGERGESEGWAEYAKGLYLQKKEPAKAQEHFNKALVLLPDSLKALNAAIAPLLEAKELDKALSVLRPIAEQNPKLLHVNVIYAHILAELKKRPEAIEHLRKCCEANGYSELKLAIPLVGYLVLEGRFNEAESVVSRLEKNPLFDHDIELVAEQAVYWNTVLGIVRDANDGKSDDGKKVKLPSKYTEKYCEQQLMHYVEKVIDCEIDTPKKMAMAGDLFSTFERWDLMWRMLDGIKDESLRNTVAYISMRLDTLKKRGDKEEFMKYAHGFLKEGNIVPSLKVKLAQCFQGMKDYADAIELVEELVERMPRNIEFKRWLAQLYISDKQYDAARYLKHFTDNTQFVLVTHRRSAMEEANVLYGVTMQADGVSRLLKLEHLEDAPVDNQ